MLTLSSYETLSSHDRLRGILGIRMINDAESHDIIVDEGDVNNTFFRVGRSEDCNEIRKQISLLSFSPFDPLTLLRYDNKRSTVINNFNGNDQLLSLYICT